MIKYKILLNILDQIRNEAGEKLSKKYAFGETDLEKINQARARAFIHLYLKVSFGLLDFTEREHYVTDGSFDGGIDGYFIHKDSKTIFFIQSKFRTNKENFENKNIKLEEILVMDINRILEGEDKDEQGNSYNGKIKQLQREVSEVGDIARYKYYVVLLANLTTDLTPAKMRYLTGGYPIDVINYEKCYNQLVFPVISGTYFNATDLNIFIDLSNKNAGSKISYTVQTKKGECEITVLFVPTLEIAKVLKKYKNSILKYNPRSYLELEGQKVNNAIRETILNESTNEFALFNNGITMLSDETYINERIGQKNKAQLTVINPQIINGGQTAFTLSKILEEKSESVFENKEVLLKVITLLDNQNGDSQSINNNIDLIDSISTATNQQTAVIPADRYSNEHYHVNLQKVVFDRFGVLYERKRGEFSDGLNQNYLKSHEIVERNLFYRILYASDGQINKAANKKLFQQHNLHKDITSNKEHLDKFYFAFLCFKRLRNPNSFIGRKDRSVFGQIYVYTRMYKPNQREDFTKTIDEKMDEFMRIWKDFEEHVSNKPGRFNRTYIDKNTKEVHATFSTNRWYRSIEFEKDLIEYFTNNYRQHFV